MLVLAATFTITSNQGEDFLTKDDEYQKSNIIVTAYVKTVDFVIAKDGYRFSSVTGITAYVIGILYLNIIIINLVVALVGDVYDEVNNVRA